MDKGTLDPKTNVWSWTLYYITQDPNTGDMYIGGEKQKLDQLFVSDDAVIGDIPEEALSKTLPRIFSEGWKDDPVVKKMWSGIMAFTADMLPLVGQLTEGISGRKGDGEWFAGGYNGHGMDKAVRTFGSYGFLLTDPTTPPLLSRHALISTPVLFGVPKIFRSLLARS